MPVSALTPMVDEPEPADGPGPGPHVVAQVFTATTGWGYAARCGCGWKTAHDTRIAALVAGQRHLRSEHATS